MRMNVSSNSTGPQTPSGCRSGTVAGVGVKYYHFDPLCENEFLFSRREVNI